MHMNGSDIWEFMLRKLIECLAAGTPEDKQWAFILLLCDDADTPFRP
jgi:hypothetical protein